MTKKSYNNAFMANTRELTVATVAKAQALTFPNDGGDFWVRIEERGGAKFKTSATGSGDGFSSLLRDDGGYLELDVEGKDVYVTYFGAIPDGASGTPTDNSAALQAALDYVQNAAGGYVLNLGIGDFGFSSTLLININGMGITGTKTPGFRPQGSTPSGAVLRWIGGGAPMFQVSESLVSWSHMSIVNSGSATDFIEALAGFQHGSYENLSFVGGTGNKFSRSVFYSLDRRYGYSKFKGCLVKSPADVFLYTVDSENTGTTPIHFDDRCIFDASNGDMTIVKFDNSAIDSIIFKNCTLNSQGNQLTVFDNTGGVARNCLAFTFEDNELDAVSTQDAAWRFFRFRNVANIKISNNVINGGGTMTHFATLENSHVIACEGNEYKSLGGGNFFEVLDSVSTINVGKNKRNNATAAEFATETAGIIRPTYGTVVQLNLNDFPAYKNGVYEIEVTDAVAYSIRLDKSPPQTVLPGQVFTVVIKNLSGGAIDPGSFIVNMNVGSATVAPADGKCFSYTFYYNGTNAIEIGRSSAEVNI